MKVNYNLTGKDRKALVEFIGQALEEKPKYLGMPSAAYQIGDFTVSKTGELEFDDSIDAANLLEAIKEAGFTEDAEETPAPAEAEAPAETETESSEEGAAPEIDGLKVEMLRSFFTETSLENLKRIVESKETLIKAALGVHELPIEITDEKVEFPWFPETDAETAAAGILFIAKLSEMAKNAKRVTAVDKEVDNPKYAMRCFLLRLGFIGAEYKAERKTLLKRLSGNSSWKNGRKGDADDEISE